MCSIRRFFPRSPRSSLIRRTARSAALAAGVLVALPARGQTRIPISILEYNAAACQEALPRSGGDRTGASWCVRGVVKWHGPLSEVLVDDRHAVLRPDSSGGTQFTGFAHRDTSTVQVVTVTVRTADGITAQDQYRLTSTASFDPAHPERQTFVISNLHPRLAGDGPEPPAASTSWHPQQPASTSPSAPGTSSSAGAPAAAPVNPAVDSAARVAAAPAGTTDAASQYIRIQEPQGWSPLMVEGGRGIGVSVRRKRSLRVIGYASHPNGVAAVEVDGHPAAIAEENPGVYRFTGLVSADSAGQHDVAVVVRGQSGLPVIGHYSLGVTPADRTYDSTSEAFPGSSSAPGQRWAVVVGISAYQDTTLGALRYADADARAFYEFLRSPRAGAGGLPDDHVKLLLNEHATYAEVRDAFFGFLRRSNPNDEVIIYFAGHGAPDPSNELYLLTYDTRSNAMASTAFPMRDVAVAVKQIRAKNIVLITDACHGGALGKLLADRRGALDLAQLNNAFISNLASSNGGLAVLNATEANQLSAEGPQWGGGHGVFTYYLLQGLGGSADADGDHIVTMSELMVWTFTQVSAATHNDQIPSIGNQSYDHSLPMSLVLDSLPQPAPQVPSTPCSAGPAAGCPTPAPVISAALADSLARAREAVGIFPNSAQYRGKLGRVLLRAGMIQEAIAAFRDAARLDPQSAEFQFDLGRALSQAGGHTEDAAAAFDAALARDPNNAEFYAGYGSALMLAGQNEAGVEKLRRAVRMLPASAEYQALLGRALRATNHPRDAAAALRIATTLDGGNVGYRRDLALALSDDSRSDEAVAVLREAVRAAPDTADLQDELGKLLQSAGDLDGARVAFTAAVRVDSASAAYHSRLGQVLRDQGLKYEAILEFRTAARLAPTEGENQFQLGELFTNSDQPDSALAHLQEAVRLATGNAAYHNALGTALRHVSRPVDALQELIQAVRLDGTQAKYQYDLGMMYVETGNNTDAIAALTQAVKLAPDDREYSTALRALTHRGSH